MTNVAARSPGSLGSLLRHWRSVRRLSQQEVALTANISARHLSFIETGRAQPSRDMVLLVGDVLGVPARERNALLQAAGYAPMHSAIELDAEEMSEMRRALRLVLKRQEPFGAVVIDRRWDILMFNEGLRQFLIALGEATPPVAYTVTKTPRANWLRILLAPGRVRTRIANWAEVALAILGRVQREVWNDPEQQALLRELQSYPGLPQPARTGAPVLLIPVRLRMGDRELSLFSTISSLGTAQDITLQELKIDTFHPLDAEAEKLLSL